MGAGRGLPWVLGDAAWLGEQGWRDGGLLFCSTGEQVSFLQEVRKPTLALSFSFLPFFLNGAAL